MSKLLGFIIGGLYGLLIVLFFIKYVTFSIGIIIIVLLSIVISLYAAIIIHELGHAIVGKIQGMALLELSIGPFVFVKEEKTIHFHYVKKMFGYAGRVVMYFPKQLCDEKMRDKLITYIYGGPLTNIIIGVAFLVMSLVWIHHPALFIFGLINLYLGSTNLIPAQTKAIMTDGFHIKKLKATPVEQSILIHVHKQLTIDYQTKSPAHWNRQLIEKLGKLMVEQCTAQEALTLLSLLSYYYIHIERPEVIRELGEKMAFPRTEKQNDMLQDMTDITYATALFFSNELLGTVAIDQKLKQIGDIDPITKLKTKALQCYLGEEYEKAIYHLNEAYVILEKWHPLYLKRDAERSVLLKMIETMTIQLNNDTLRTP